MWLRSEFARTPGGRLCVVADPRAAANVRLRHSGFYLATIKDVVENGWFVRNPDLGAPFGQSNFDFAAMFGDLPHYGIVKLLAVVIGDPVITYNAFYLLCFALIAVVAYGVCAISAPCAPSRW